MQDIQNRGENCQKHNLRNCVFTDRNLLQNRFYNFVISAENRENLSAMLREMYSSQSKRAQIQHR